MQFSLSKQQNILSIYPAGRQTWLRTTHFIPIKINLLYERENYVGFESWLVEKNASHFFNYFQMNETIQKRFWKVEKITFVHFQCDVETATGVYSCLSVDMMFKRQVCSTTTIPLLCCLDHTYYIITNVRE